MTGSLDGSQKYGSPRLTSQSIGYEPSNAPAAAISVMTVLDFTTAILRDEKLTTSHLYGNRARARRPAPQGVCARALATLLRRCRVTNGVF
jgi:hypothetical protein